MKKSLKFNKIMNSPQPKERGISLSRFGSSIIRKRFVYTHPATQASGNSILKYTKANSSHILLNFTTVSI